MLAAFREATKAWGWRADAAPLNPGLVTWAHAALAIIVLLVVQALLLVGSAGSSLAEAMPALLDIGLVTVLAFAVPFVVVAGFAVAMRQAEKLPLLFAFVALCLLLIQVVNFALTYAGMRSSSTLVVLTALVVGRGVRTVLGASIAVSILAGVLAGAGTVAVSMLLLALPTGQAMVAAS
jgi:hypothetical protein